MQRVVTVIERVNGTAVVAKDKETIECTDDFAGVDALVQAREAAGDCDWAGVVSIKAETPANPSILTLMTTSVVPSLSP